MERAFRLDFLAALLVMLLQLGAAPTPDPHTITINLIRDDHARDARYVLGIVVLGTHVHDVHVGMLVKEPPTDGTKIDWVIRRLPVWTLANEHNGPHDVTQSRLDSIVQIVESLGFPPSVVHAQRVIAPVGFDSYHENEKTLAIGEIFVDLGSPDDARATLRRLNTVLMTRDPFSPSDVTVRYASQLFVRTDCNAATWSAQREALADAVKPAETIADYNAQNIAYSSSTTTTSGNLLCPRERIPVIETSTDLPDVPDVIDLRWSTGTHIVYRLEGFSSRHFPITYVPPSYFMLEQAEESYGFQLDEPYAATFGTASIAVHPRGFIVHAVRRTSTADDVAALQSLARRPDDLLVLPNDIFVRVAANRAADLRVLTSRHLRVVAFADCATAQTAALREALVRSHTRATIVARSFGARVSRLGSARLDAPKSDGILCGSGREHAPLTSFFDDIEDTETPLVTERLNFAVTAAVDAAWTLKGIAHPSHALVQTSYSGQQTSTVVETAITGALSDVLKSIHRDGSAIYSIYETAPVIGTFEGVTTANAEFVVVR